ncbi:hypothetical protein DFH09DRAFT_1288205 [Mycena vulgaris]|nr:hypothetical protein DFH09DRAFT_1288205 [Mycena vulgaris]
MVDLDAAGKTAILYKLKLGEIVTTIPTIGTTTIDIHLARDYYPTGTHIKEHPQFTSHNLVTEGSSSSSPQPFSRSQSCPWDRERSLYSRHPVQNFKPAVRPRLGLPSARPPCAQTCNLRGFPAAPDFQLRRNSRASSKISGGSKIIRAVRNDNRRVTVRVGTQYVSEGAWAQFRLKSDVLFVARSPNLQLERQFF